MRVRSVSKVIDHQGLQVHVEYPVGTVKEGKDHEGKPYRCEYSADYGFIRHPDGDPIVGDDGEDYDAFLGPSSHAKTVHVVTQLRAASGYYDEQKLMLGYDSAEDARRSYLAHRHPDMLGRIGSLSLDDFKAQLAAHKASGSKDPFRAETDEDAAEAATMREIAKAHGLAA